MPIASFSTLATGARQLVVHEALETIVCVGGQLVVIDAVDDGQVDALGRGRDQHPLGAGSEMRARLLAIGEEAGAFERDVDAVGGVRQLARIALGGDLDALAVDDQVVAVGADLARIGAVDANRA